MYTKNRQLQVETIKNKFEYVNKFDLLNIF